MPAEQRRNLMKAVSLAFVRVATGLTAVCERGIFDCANAFARKNAAN